MEATLHLVGWRFFLKILNFQLISPISESADNDARVKEDNANNYKGDDNSPMSSMFPFFKVNPE